MKAIKLVTVLVLLSIFSIHSFAQEGKKLDYPTLGISLIVPSGFQYEEGDEAVMMANPSIQNTVFLVTMHEYTTMEQLEAVAREPYTEDNGTYLQIDGETERINDDAIAGFFKGFAGGYQAEAYIMAKLNPFGSGISVVGMTIAGQASKDKLKEVVMMINEGVEVRQREIGNIVKEWTDYLNNTQLVYRSNYSSPSYTDGGVSGYSSSTESYDICEQGYFIYGGSSSMSVGSNDLSVLGNSNSSSQGSGSWEIDADAEGKPVLVLKYTNGKVERWTLYYEGGYLYLDDYKHTVGRGAEYGPRCN